MVILVPSFLYFSSEKSIIVPIDDTCKGFAEVIFSEYSLGNLHSCEFENLKISQDDFIRVVLQTETGIPNQYLLKSFLVYPDKKVLGEIPNFQNKFDILTQVYSMLERTPEILPKGIGDKFFQIDETQFYQEPSISIKLGIVTTLSGNLAPGYAIASKKLFEEGYLFYFNQKGDPNTYLVYPDISKISIVLESN
jgi:hypothetical protein